MSQQPEGYSTRDVAGIVGVTFDRMHAWAAEGLLEPSIAGPERQRGLKSRPMRGRRVGTQDRIYSYDDLLVARLIRDLRARGLSMQQIRRAVATLRREVGARPLHQVVAGDVVLTIDARGRLALVEDGAQVAWSVTGRGGPMQGVIRNLDRDVRELLEDWQRTQAGGAVGEQTLMQVRDVNRITRRAMPRKVKVTTT